MSPFKGLFQQITYVLVNGDTQLFSIEPESGRITTIRGLDYEQAPRHTIVVGTLENPNGPQVGWYNYFSFDRIAYLFILVRKCSYFF